MKVYQDLDILPDGEISLAFLWEKLYSALHLAMVRIKDDNNTVPIAAAFPQYIPILDKAPKSHPLGRQLRLLAPLAADLERLDLSGQLSGLKDYVYLKGIRDVPGSVQSYVCFRRHQTKSSNQRIARRKARREGMSVAQALAVLEAGNQGRIKVSRAPFIHIKSTSSGQKFRLMIEQIDATEPLSQAQHAPRFSTYGLGTGSPLPQF